MGSRLAPFEARETRFWERVQRTPDGCWEWQGALTNGYGELSWEGRVTRAHRVAYLLANAPIGSGLDVCHACDNRRCCRPSHLWLGTPKQNNQDMWAKGRGRYVAPDLRGSQRGTAKLTEAQVVEIRRLCADGARQKTVAERYGVQQNLVSRIVNRRIWTHV